jgi:hypothetical protein
VNWMILSTFETKDAFYFSTLKDILELLLDCQSLVWVSERGMQTHHAVQSTEKNDQQQKNHQQSSENVGGYVLWSRFG